MNFEILKKSYLKRNIIIGVVAALVISAVILNFTRAKYRVTQSIPLVNGTINYSLADLNVVAITIDGQPSDTIPDGDYNLLDTSYCTVDGEEDTTIELSYDSATNTLNIIPFTIKGTKCYLNFEKKLTMNIQEFIENKEKKYRTDFSEIITEDTSGTIYYTDTSNGRTYYFAGNPTDNWIKFAGFYWRIIRINENGSMRIIYNGTNPDFIGDFTQLSNSAFNNSDNNNMYVGYMYEDNQVHGISNSSVIKEEVEQWYELNLLNYANYLDYDAGFCGDRFPSTSYSSSNGLGGTGTTITYYGGYVRFNRTRTPTFECNSLDLYTSINSNEGNKSLQYPIGLISMDEVWYAGGNQNENKNYYLYTEKNYWTMTPYYCDSTQTHYANIFYVSSNGNIDGLYTTYEFGIRPVINLKGDIQFTGSGTTTDPYIVVS